MDPITRQAIAVAGGAAASDPLYVDDLFSTFLYEGNASARSINNGLDLSGEGGLAWLKARDQSFSHFLFDTERGASSTIGPDSTGAAYTSSRLSSFDSNGFSLTNDSYANGNGNDYASWTFRKAPGFFDVVTYTGNGTAGRTISHNLGSVPGMIIVKKTNDSSNWCVYHRSTGNTKAMYLNTTVGAFTAAFWNNTSPTSTEFTVNADGWINGSGGTYVAYLFAHDDQSFGTDEDEAIIKCGSYTGNGSSGNFVNVGFEPQFLLIKNATTASTNWMLLDVMRGLPAASGSTAAALYANTTAAEAANNSIEPSPTGFTPTGAGSYTNSTGDTFVYMAIRRPNKPPTAGTEVFGLDTFGGISPNPPGFNAGFPVDMAFLMETTLANTKLQSRLTQGRRLFTNLSNAEDDDSGAQFDYQDGWHTSTAVTTSYVSWMFKRAPGYFDVVAYTGTGSLSGVNHNLGVTPELKIIKKRSGTGQWVTGGTAVAGENGYFYLDSNDALHSNSGYWSGGDDSATKFSVKNGHSYSDSSGSTYVAYLFATLDGISKVGSYSGTGSNIDVDCGFAAGARFVLIKRTDSSGDWYVWDTLRGIVSGNDPYKLLNSTAAQVTNTDYIDPLNAGFTVTSSAPAALNTSGGTYLFLAIA